MGKCRNKNLLYAAGFIDGTGCFTTINNGFNLVIYCSNKKVLLWFRKVFGGRVTDQWSFSDLKHRSKAWKWELNRSRFLYLFLVEIYPYLKVKRMQVECVLNFLEKYPREYKNKIMSERRRKDFIFTKEYLRLLKFNKKN
jgi:hypothetical protein